MSWYTKIVTAENIQALSLSLLLFTYLILVLSASQIHYTETVHRITVERIFNENLFGSSLADAVAVIGFMLLFFCLTLRNGAVVRSVCILAFALTIIAAIIGLKGVEIAGLVTLPLLAAVVVINPRLAITSTRSMEESARVAVQENQKKLNLGMQLPRAHQVGLALLLIIIVIESAALTRWLTYPALPTEMYSDASWKFAKLESALLQTFGLLSPLMIVLIAFSFLYKNYVQNFVSKIMHWRHRTTKNQLSNLNGKRYEPSVTNSPASKKSSSFGTQTQALSADKAGKISLRAVAPHWVILSSALIIAPLLVLYPHLPGINQSGSGISTDERSYLNWLFELRKTSESQGSWAASISETIGAAFMINSGDRPLSLLLMLALSNLSGLPDSYIVRFVFPAILAPAFVASSYIFVRHGLPYDITDSESTAKNKKTAATVAMIAALSPQIVIGLYAGLLSNWVALIPALFAMLFVIKIINHVERFTFHQASQFPLVFYALGFFACLSLTMLLHIYTWGFVILATILFTGISYISLRNSHFVIRRKLLEVIAILATVVLASIIADYAKSSYFAVSSGLSRDSFVAGGSFNLENFHFRWENLDFTLRTYLGGSLTNPVLLVLALVWLFRANYVNGFDRMLYSMFFILVIPILFGNSGIQARILYVIPLFIPSIAATVSGRENSRGRVMVFFVVLLSLSVYALHALANLYLVVPEGFELERPFLVP
jgi:hypothetical protein